MKRALLIGINDYPVSPLKGCVKVLLHLDPMWVLSWMK